VHELRRLRDRIGTIQVAFQAAVRVRPPVRARSILGRRPAVAVLVHLTAKRVASLGRAPPG
jgi:hypothetical protein